MSLLLQKNCALKDSYLMAVQRKRRLQALHSDGDGLFWSSTSKKWIHLLRIPSSTSKAIPARHKVRSLEHLQLSKVQHCFAHRALKRCLIRCHEMWPLQAWGHVSPRPPTITSIRAIGIPAPASSLDLGRLFLCLTLSKLSSASAQPSPHQFSSINSS